MPSDHLTPDEIEQKQSLLEDDEDDETEAYRDADHPLSPDEVEQRMVVGVDEDEHPEAG
jgi:hypothetical protein